MSSAPSALRCLFRTKTRRHEDVAPAAKRLFSATVRASRTVDREMGLSAQAFFFVALWLCAKNSGRRPGWIAPASTPKQACPEPVEGCSA
jgi:hypothetical protein